MVTSELLSRLVLRRRLIQRSLEMFYLTNFHFKIALKDETIWRPLINMIAAKVLAVVVKFFKNDGVDSGNYSIIHTYNIGRPSK